MARVGAWVAADALDRGTTCYNFSEASLELLTKWSNKREKGFATASMEKLSDLLTSDHFQLSAIVQLIQYKHLFRKGGR
ncbi:MAG: hypothetical protein DRH17_00120 [Deltaproteobacteria bacterium]|nr:MAG: hypothetical protein DRH17_00120 [Deltaproteobacteria bacterium]